MFWKLSLQAPTIAVRRAQVALVSGDKVLASTWTSDSGSFSVNLTVAGNTDVTVRLCAINRKARVVPPDAPGKQYIRDLKTVTVNPNKTSWNLGTMRFLEGSYVWIMLDAVLVVSDWLFKNVQYQRPEVRIQYPSGNWPHYHNRNGQVGPGESTTSPVDTICMPDPKFSEFLLCLTGADCVENTIFHEYGHAVLWSIYAGNDPVGNGPTPHHVCSESSEGWAINEGFAFFLEQAVRTGGPSLFACPRESKGSIETNTWHNANDAGDTDGHIVEGSVASVFWDIHDGANDDKIPFKLRELWTVLTLDRPNSILGFLTAWLARYCGTGSGCYEEQLKAVCSLYGIPWPQTGQVGSLRVTIEPSGARNAGAQWRLTSGPDISWKNSDATVGNLAVGTHTVTFKAVSGWTAPADASVTISANQTTAMTRTYSQAAPPTITTPSPLPGGTVGASYNQSLAATGGTPPYTWSETGGTRPPGLNLSTAGVISGTPTTAGTYTFTVQVRDSQGRTDSRQFSITIAQASLPGITGASISPNPASPGRAVTISYQVNNPGPSRPVLLGATVWLGGTPLSDPANDRLVTLASGASTVTRTFVIPTTAALGTYDLDVSLVEDLNNNGRIDSGDRNLARKTSTGALRVVKFSVGDRVQVFNTFSAGLIVRETPCGTRLPPNKFDGETGVILEGPVFCDEHNRWRVRWSDGRIGWSAETFLRRY